MHRSNKSKDYALLETLAKTLSKNVYAINSEQRKALHVAAVFVNNFTNHLFTIGKDFCESNQVPFEILQPLIQETVEKLKHYLQRKHKRGLQFEMIKKQSKIT